MVALAGVVLAGLVVPFAREADTTLRTQDAAAGLPPGAEVVGGVTDTGAPAGSVPTGGGGSGAGGTVGGGSTTGAGAASAEGGPGTSAAGAAGGATDIGVTATEIHLGIGILDIGVAAQLGFNFDIGDQRSRYQAMIDDVNGRGGIAGRQLVPHYRTIEAARPETQQAACVGWIEDDEVFAVMVSTQFTQASGVCVTGQGATPLFMNDGFDQSYYGNGLLFTTQPSDNRILRDQARYLVDAGVLEGRTIGILSGDGAERLAIDGTLVPGLAAGGFEVAAIEEVPATVSGTQRMSIAISNFRAAGVDFVIIAANVILAGPFVQSAERAGFNPEYAISDFNQQINDQVASYYPDAFEGTIGLSTRRFSEYRAGNPPPPADQACLDRVLPADPKVLPATNSAFEVAMHECSLFDVFVAGATNAGPGLTRSSLVAGIGQIGATPLAGLYDGVFDPTRHDGGNHVREVQWHRSCQCWEIYGAIREMAG